MPFNVDTLHAFHGRVNIVGPTGGPFETDYRSMEMFRFLKRTNEIELERRREERVATFRFADICNEDEKPLVEATLREISNHGAYLRLKTSTRLPDGLLIRLQPDDMCKPAKLKWRSGPGIGVEFDQDIGPSRNSRPEDASS